MFQRFFGRRNQANRAVVDALYGQIVAAARQPILYSVWAVPDTPLGRFEMLSVHVFLFLHRVRAAAPPLPEIAQDLTDVFFADVEDALRAFGIGDLGVPKRMKKLARMFYGRAQAYGAAVDAGDHAALAAALAAQYSARRRRMERCCAARRLSAGGRCRLERPGRGGPGLRQASLSRRRYHIGERSGHDQAQAEAPSPSSPMSGACPSRACRWSSRPMKRSARRLAEDHGLLAVDRYRAELLVSRWKRHGVKVDGAVEADIVQECGVTLEPLPSHLAARFRRSSCRPNSKLGREGFETGGEILLDAEGPDSPELFSGDTIDVGALAEEFFELAIDPYARAPGASAAVADNADRPGSAFAKLAELKKR